MTSSGRRYNVHEVLCMIESGSFERADLFITPSSGEITDEDSADEDSGGLLDNLSSRQLQADCEAVVVTAGEQVKMRIGCTSGTESEEEALESGESKSAGVKRRTNSKDKIKSSTKCQKVSMEQSSKRVGKKTERKWKIIDLPKSRKATFQNEQQSKIVLQEFSPMLFFEQFFNDDIIELMVQQSILYAKSKGNHRFTVNSGEIRAFLGILTLSSYVPLARRRMFWEQKSDVHNEVASSFMARDRFEEIMRYLHFTDNSKLDGNDKFAKLRPLVVHLNSVFVSSFCQEECLSVDESMVPYYGRHGCKQFIRGKPIRFGYKVWSLNTHLGYMVQFEPYQGKGSFTYPELGLGGSVAFDLSKSLPAGPCYKFYFDNFFTSLQLLQVLTELSYGATGTIRANRTDKCPLVTPEAIKKQPRGSYDYRYDGHGKFIIIRWNDNSAVTIASNIHGVHPLEKAKRWSNSEKKKIEIDQPAAIKQYNCYMGGTDRMDQNVSCYRISIRSKKWWWALFIYFVDVAMQNAYYLYARSSEHQPRKLDFLGFKRDIVDVYSKKYSERLQMGRPVGKVPSLHKRVQHDVRYDGKDHLILYMENQQVCPQCCKKANFICKKCNVALHPKACFLEFHQE